MLAQVTVAPAITCPFWSRTSAVNRAVSPKAFSAAELGLTVTVVATGAVGGAGSTALSPQDRGSTAIPTTTIAGIVKPVLGRPDRPPPVLRRMCQRCILAR